MSAKMIDINYDELEQMINAVPKLRNDEIMQTLLDAIRTQWVGESEERRTKIRCGTIFIRITENETNGDNTIGFEYASRVGWTYKGDKRWYNKVINLMK